MKDDLTHSRSCNVWDIDIGCTCCLSERRRISEAEELLGRVIRQLEKWQSYYGDVQRLPPSGDVQLLEEAGKFLTPNKD